MRLVTRETVNDNLVVYVGQVNATIRAYRRELDMDVNLIYFVNESNEVISTMTIETDTGQGVGYISEVRLEES